MLKTSRPYRQICLAYGFCLLANETSEQHTRLILGTDFVTAALTPSDHLNMIQARATASISAKNLSNFVCFFIA